MSDKLIMKIISKIYFMILSFVFFIFLIFTFLFILLQSGIYIEKTSISNLQAKQLYIKWDEKIELSIQELALLPQKNPHNKSIDYNFMSESLKILLHILDWFSSIIIQKIVIDDFTISFNYQEDSKGFLNIDSSTLKLASFITHEKEILKLSIIQLEEEIKKISLQGDIYLDLNAQELYSRLNVTINNDAHLEFFSILNTEKIKFIAQSQKDIKNVKEIIALAKLPEEIKFWAYDAIALENFHVESLRGEVEFANIEETYKNIYFKAKAEKLIYTYNIALDKVRSSFTELELKEGILYIKPINAHSYNNNLGKSWLKIDFTQEEEILALYLLFDGTLNKDILKILNTYKIKLPFLQKSGTVKSDLTLLINLATIDVDAQGVFKIKNGNFDYLGLDLDISDAQILLNNYDVKIPSMYASYKDIATAKIKVDFDAKTSEGKIDFLFDSISLKGVKLNSNESQLQVGYIISPKQDMIKISKSHWHINDYALSVNSIEIPFDLTTLKVKLPTTHIAIGGISTAFVSGEIDIKKESAQLLVDVLSLSYKGINFSQAKTPFLLKYSDKLSITSPKILSFNIAGTEYLLEKPTILINEEEIVLKNSKLSVGKYATAKIYVKYDINKSKAHVSLSDLVVTDSKKENTLFSKKKVLLSIKDNNNTLVVNSDELGATFTSDEEGWELYINSLSGLVSDSEFLQKLNIDTGEFTLYKEKNQHNVGFSANIIYPYKLLTQDDIPTNEYAIEGEIKNELFSFIVNKNTSVSIGEKIQIDMKKTGININELINAVAQLQKNEENNTSSEKISLTLSAVDSYLYITETRKALSDRIELQYKNEMLSAKLLYKEGKASLNLKEKHFHLNGKDFNDAFMNELFSPSKFKGGSLEFLVNGTTDIYDGIFHISNTTILNYKLLNNILAFVNTVPSLITFSLPGYSSKGLYVEEGYVNFQAKDKFYTFLDIYLKSKELNILGKGNADFNNDTIDVRLNLQTDLGSNISQIPLVGYILFDKESVSTSINLKGDLKDPKIESLLVTDIAVAPINIIKRTLSLPYDFFKSIGTDANISN